MSGKRFLLITYYWPPSGGAGVMRWLKMSKYIREAGWEPIVYTHLDGEIAVEDPSLVDEVPSDLTILRHPIWEPYKIYKWLLGRSPREKLYSGFIQQDTKPSLTQRLSVWIRGNFFIPDARMFWIRPSARFLIQWLQANPVDAIVTTGPPHSLHLIGRRLHRSTGIPWITDFRDPWTNIDFYQDLHLTRWADARHRHLEMAVLRECSRIVTVTWRSREEFEALCGRTDIEVVPNGFDEADFPAGRTVEPDPDFSFVHFGSMNKDRNPVVFWQAVQKAVEREPALADDLRIRLYGPVDFSVRQSVSAFGLDALTTYIDYVPHAEVVRLQQQARIVLLVINNSPNARTIIPGKLYEYLGSRRPLLAIGPPDSDSARVIRMTRAGVVHDYTDVAGLTDRILEYYLAWQAGTLSVRADGIEQFSRRHLAHQFAGVLDDVLARSNPDPGRK